MEQSPSTLPVLPIRNAVLFPTVSMPLVVGRPRSLHALEQAEVTTGGLLIVVAQRNITVGDPGPPDLYSVGTLCKIENITATDSGSKQVVVTGIARYRIANYELVEAPSEPHLIARGEIAPDTHALDPIRNQALLGSLKSVAREILDLLPGTTEPLVRLIERVEDSSYLANVCAAYLNLSLFQKQEMLEIVEVEKRMELLLSYMRKEREVLSLQREIREKMSERLNKAQREALLREQLRTIRSELGEESGEEAADEIEEKVLRANLSVEAARQAQEELKRLRALPEASAEYHVVRSYLELIVSLPWCQSTQDLIDLKKAREILDQDHYGLETVKRRILQFLAVAKLKNDLHGPILCLVGPPGVGKTSLGQSIARTLGRKFIRTSLGGVRDEAEIRGHRRTYVGAMPGRIIQSIKRVGTRNPVMMLDEIDKLRSDFHGDPSSAMLEVLDPEQNKSFADHYLDIPFDLSGVFFVATANVMDTIPGPLRDRMEMIELNGYTTQEKLRIAMDYLIPKELKAHGLTAEGIYLPEESVIRLITHYTREAGVRELSRKLAALFRGAAEEIVSRPPLISTLGLEPSNLPDPEIAPIQLTADRLLKILGPERHRPEQSEQVSVPGVAAGLAWTPHGGDLLFIEATRMTGRGKLTLTGQLGDVMKESAQIALSLARASVRFFPNGFDFSKQDIHIHVPSGAIPKDGPSAGVTMLVALISLILDRAVPMNMGFTGEITLRGAVLPVGGIKEKILAAHRAGLRAITMPRRNEIDLTDVPEEIRNQIKFSFVDTIDDFLISLFQINRASVVREITPSTKFRPESAA